MHPPMITPDHSPAYVNLFSDEEITASVARVTDARLRDHYRLLCLDRDEA